MSETKSEDKMGESSENFRYHSENFATIAKFSRSENFAMFVKFSLCVIAIFF